MTTILTVASDGSCLKNPGGEIGWAWADDRGRWQAYGYKSGTNQQAELLGFLSVLRAFSSTPLHVLLDSQYTLNAAFKWVNGWARNGWVNSKKEPVSNQNILLPIYEEMQRRKRENIPTTSEWVKGHSITELNNVADKYALHASRAVQNEQNPYIDSQGNIRSPRQEEMLRLVGLN